LSKLSQNGSIWPINQVGGLAKAKTWLEGSNIVEN